MKQRKLGLELELFVTKQGERLAPGQWVTIIDRAIATGCSKIEDSYTGFPLGVICEKGQFVLDNNCSIVEMVTLPHDRLDQTLQNLVELIAFFESIAPEFKLHWTSQYAEPDENEYWQRAIPSGLYSMVREKNWQHWRLMNSMAFQPAIDLCVEEIGPVLRVLYMTAPVFICAFEGNNRWGGKHSPRLENWQKMIPDGKFRTGLPSQEIQGLSDYVENLLNLPPFVLSDGLKKGKMTFFTDAADAQTVGDVMFGDVVGKQILSVSDHRAVKDQILKTKDVHVRGDISNFYGLALPFWHARLVFETDQKGSVQCADEIVAAIEKSSKLYVEIRHMGTPRNIHELKQIYQSFLNLIENAKALDEKISALIDWDEIADENQLAMHDGKLSAKGRAVFNELQKLEILPGVKL